MSHKGACVVCGGQPNGSRYGPITCLGCIVFFRRAVQQGTIGECERQCKRNIGFDLKASCRSCRLKECLNAGMDPSAIQYRDKLGPRKPRSSEADSIIIQLDTDFSCLLQLQRKQRELHQRYSSGSKEIDKTSLVKIRYKYYRRAKPYDIDLVLKLGFRNATDWAKQFNAFWNLKELEKKLVISEFGIAFVLIDQAHKTSCKADYGFWLLQNDSFLHSDYFFGMGKEEEESIHRTEDTMIQAWYHNDFVTDLLRSLRKPFSALKIDKLECVLLKTLLLLTPSFPGKIRLDDSEKIISKCMSNLMNYSNKKSPENGITRFGEIILLIGSIRSAVKTLYNHTKRSVHFDISKFDSFVRSSFLA